MDSVHGAAKHHKHNKTTRKLLQESAKKRGKNVSQVLIIIIEEFSRSKQYEEKNAIRNFVCGNNLPEVYLLRGYY